MLNLRLRCLDLVRSNENLPRKGGVPRNTTRHLSPALTTKALTQMVIQSTLETSLQAALRTVPIKSCPSLKELMLVCCLNPK